MRHIFTQLIEQVRISLDQNIRELTVLRSDDGTLSLDDIIRQKLMMSAKWLLERAPLSEIDYHLPLTKKDAPTQEDGYLAIALPADYLRLYCVKVSSWDIPLSEPLPKESEWGMIAKSEFPGIRPNGHRPLLLMSETNSQLECYGSPGTVERAEYIPLPKVDSNLMEYPIRLIDALIHLATSMVLDTWGSHDRGAYYRTLAMDSAKISNPSTTDKKR